MTQTFKLSIPTPCSQKWSSFTPTATGGFCSSCNKVVVDFTAMTDDQIIAYFQASKENTCGRFAPGQLKGYSLLKTSNVRPGFPLFKAGLLALLFLLIKPSVTDAQVEKPKTEQIESTAQAEDIAEGQPFRGTVMSAEDRSPLPGVNIVLKGTPFGTITTAEGKFEFPKKVKAGDVLVFSFIGLVTKEYVIKDQRDLQVDMPMLLCMNMDITGEVAVDGIYEEPKSKSLWGKLKEFVSR